MLKRLVIIIALALLVFPITANAQLQGSLFRVNGSPPSGSDILGDIYEIDVNDGDSTLLSAPFTPEPTPSLGTGNVNGNACQAFFDSPASVLRFYYSSSPNGCPATGGPYYSELYFYDGSINVDADQNLTGDRLAGCVAGATFYNGAYWYIDNATDDLRIVSFDSTTGLALSDTFVCDITNNVKDFRFGDIAADENGVMYGVAQISNASPTHIDFFMVDLTQVPPQDSTDCSSAYTYISDLGGPPCTNDVAGGTLQLGFVDGNLYASAAGSGVTWIIDDLVNGKIQGFECAGNATPEFTSSNSGDSLGFADLSSECVHGNIILDNKPQSFPNALNLCGKGKIPFAFVSTQDIDACSLQFDTLLVNGAEVDLHKCSCEDVVGPEEQTIENPGSEDGIDDLACRLKTSSLRESGAVMPGDTEWEICVADSTLGLVLACGTDSIKITQHCDANGDRTFIQEEMN